MSCLPVSYFVVIINFFNFRQCRLVDISTKKTVQRVHKSNIPTPPDYPLRDKTVRLFYDDTFKSFFRRLTFSTDGTLIIVPSGIIEPQDTIEKTSNATIVFSRHNLKEFVLKCKEMSYPHEVHI